MPQDIGKLLPADEKLYLQMIKNLNTTLRSLENFGSILNTAQHRHPDKFTKKMSQTCSDIYMKFMGLSEGMLVSPGLFETRSETELAAISKDITWAEYYPDMEESEIETMLELQREQDEMEEEMDSEHEGSDDDDADDDHDGDECEDESSDEDYLGLGWLSPWSSDEDTESSGGDDDSDGLPNATGGRTSEREQRNQHSKKRKPTDEPVREEARRWTRCRVLDS